MSIELYFLWFQIAETINTEKLEETSNWEHLVPPNSNFQFVTEWKSLKGKARSHYLSVSILRFVSIIFKPISIINY